MTREDIIKMAREAGFATSWTEAAGEALERFAELVTAKEREACAKLCEELLPGNGSRTAAAIRARGGK